MNPQNGTRDDFQHALIVASRMERESGERHHVIETYDGRFIIESGPCPIMGTWYSADGRRHG